MKNNRAAEILRRHTNLGYGIVIEGDTKKIEEALSIAIGALGKHDKEDEIETLIKPYYDNAFVGCVQQGWQCPICNRVYSPYTFMCYYCGQAVTTTTSIGTGEPLVKDKKNDEVN